MTPLSVGVDLVELDRIERAVDRHGERFLERIYTPEELARYRQRLPELAARFAAKEAVSKCFTTGIGEALGWKSIEVVKGDREEPLIRLDERGLALMQQLGANDVLVSLSHTANYGLATAVLVARPEQPESLS